MWRLSFSRAEVVLLNSWTPMQQIVNHMLRFFVKTEKLSDLTNSNEAKQAHKQLQSKVIDVVGC